MGVSVIINLASTNMVAFLKLSLLASLIALANGCGEDLNNRIVGGDETQAHAIPWQVGLAFPSGFFFCGGTIICDRWILTAAHCNANTNFVVVAQEHDKSNGQGGSVDGTRHTVKQKIPHPNYGGDPPNNDFMLVELNEPLSLTGDSKARAACLPTAADKTSYQGATFVVSGWGALEEGSGGPDKLHSAKVPHITNQVCNEQGKYGGQVTEQMICAGHLAGGIDSCQGDSGGPLTWADQGKVKVVGVVSWGFGCARPNLPGVYAEVAEVLDWIEKETSNCAGNVATTAGPNTNTTAGPNPTTAGPNSTTTDVPVPTTTDVPVPTTTGNGTTSDCGSPQWFGDGWCDDENNNAACGWDGGDCCVSTNGGPINETYCKVCQCLDPDNQDPCEDIWKPKRCNRIKKWKRCGRKWPKKKCAKTCGHCPK